MLHISNKAVSVYNIAFYSTRTLIQHRQYSGSVVSTPVSQQGGPGFDSYPG